MTSAATVLARAGLVGHPSDGYGGATLSVTLANFSAEVEAKPASTPLIAPAGDGRRLIAAALEEIGRPAVVRYRSTIPREVGLGGSSALVIATLRALTDLPVDELPERALAVERRLGIVAGLQDRVVQAHGGLVFMDFERDRIERLDCALLPPLLLAWRPDSRAPSGGAHAAVRARFDAGDASVVAAMRTLATLARDARDALLRGDRDAFAAALDAGYEVRAAIFDLDPRHTAMIDAARAHGMHATYTGSGGAIVAIESGDPQASVAFTRAVAPLGVWVVAAQPADQASSSGSGSIG